MIELISGLAGGGAGSIVLSLTGSLWLSIPVALVTAFVVFKELTK